MLSYFQKKYSHFVLKPYLVWHFKKKRHFYYENLKLIIYPSVFHPNYFFSTYVLLDFIKNLKLEGNSFCEVGAGSGLISMYAFKMGANVTCLDINESAVKGLEENFKTNFAQAKQNHYQIYKSDLFARIPSQIFDFIVINPPYFFADPINPTQEAWYCGKNGEYFEKLFSELLSYTNDKTQIYLILSDSCEIGRIQQIANKYQIVFILVHEEKVKWENNCIFKLILK